MGYEPVGEGRGTLVQAQDIIGNDRRKRKRSPEDHPANRIFGMNFGAYLGIPTAIGLTGKYTG